MGRGSRFFIRLGTPNERDGQRDRGVRRRDVEINGHWLNSCTEAQPYQPGSPLPIRNSEVKQVRAGVVLRWGTTREGPVLRFLHVFVSSRFSFLFLKPSRFSLCSPSFYVPHSLGHRHFICVSMRRKRSLRAGPGTFSVRGGARGQHPPLSDGTKGRTPTSLYALGSSCRCIAYEECAECHEPMCDDCLWGDSNLEALRGTPRPAMNAVHSSASIAAPSHCPATWGNALR